MNPSPKKVKYLVIIGYVLVVSVLIIGITSMYNNLVDFSEKKIRDEDLTELVVAGNILSKLYEIESSQNLLNAQSAEKYFSKYDSILPIIQLQIDSLKHLSKDSLRVVKLDSIEMLLDYKNKNLREIVALLDSIQKAPRITRETVSTIVPPRLNKDISTYLESTKVFESDTTKIDTTVVYGNRKRFVDRVRDVFVGRVDSTVVVQKQQTVLPSDYYKSVIDTVVNMVRYSERIDLENQRRFQYILLERQNLMIGTNTKLTTQIDELLKGIEQEELNKSIQLLQDRDYAISKAAKIARVVAWLAVLIGVIFGGLLVLDINRSQRYRKQLEASNQRINELLKSREQFMLAVSHDIKAPMSSVLGYIEMMRTKLPDDKKQLYLSNMKNSSEHVLHLVANLLDFYKLESGTMTLKEVNVNLYDLTENTVDSFRPLAEQKNLTYTVNNKVNQNLIGYTDPYVVRQIMSNVISNAIKYTFKGFVSVDVDSEKKDSQLWLNFSVKDSGVGISEDDQRIIFEEFRQLENSQKEIRIEGSGLGLAITQRLINAIGGQISVQSEEGKGSHFTVKLPIMKGQLNLPIDIPEENREYKLDNINVFMVDDDSVQLRMASEMLLLRKAHVLTENDPTNARDILLGSRFDILFVDIQMPQMNGFELVRKIRELKNYQNTPIIALSAKSDMSKSDVQAAGFTDFLTKPFTSDALYATVSNYVKGEEVINKITKQKEKNLSLDKIETLISFVREDKSASMEILEAFIKDESINLYNLKEAFEAKNNYTASRLAHKMLPLIQMIGDTETTDYLKRLEKGEVLPSEVEDEIVKRLDIHIQEAEVLRKEIAES